MIEMKTKEEARQAILSGARQLAEAVVSTLGPWGRNVSIRRPPVPTKDGGMQHRPPLITKDGVTVARFITELPDPFEDMGAQLVKEAAERTNRIVGDGTTTAVMLAHEMMEDGMELLKEGGNAIHIRRGMQLTCEVVCKKLETMKREVKTLDEFRTIATIAAAGDGEIGSMVALVIDEVGKNGAVTIAGDMGIGLQYKVTDGMQIPVGFSSPYFAGAKGIGTVEDAYVLVTTEKITSIRTIAPVLAKISEQNDKHIHLVIFSSGVDGDALFTLVKNHTEHPDKFRFLILNPPFYGSRQQEILEDIAIATGAKLIDRKLGLSIDVMPLSALGMTKRADATNRTTTLAGTGADKELVRKRIELIRAAKSEDQDYMNMRIAGLEGKIATILVGGSSVVEQQERLHRMEDAVAATRAAHESGILPGGGTAFLRCEDCIVPLNTEAERQGAGIVLRALSKQLYWIANNAGEDAGQIVKKVRRMKDIEGYNAETGKYGDMFAMKVIDPSKVPITALRNAVSVAGMFLTLEVAVVEK